MPGIALLLWLAYFLLPTEGRWIDGLPVGRSEAVGLLLVLWIAAHRVRLPGAVVVAAAVVGTLSASLAVPGDPGLNARYYAAASLAGPHERGLEPGDPAFTRVDRRLDFVRGVRDFPLVFFNDHGRFNLMQPGDPDRHQLPFAAAWSGWWWTPAGQHTVYLDAPGATAEMAIDAAPVVAGSTILLAEGWHRLHVTVVSPYGAPRTFSAGEIVAGIRRPFDANLAVRTERIDRRQAAIASALNAIKQLTDVIAFAMLAVLAAGLVMRRAGEAWQHPAAVRPYLWLFAAAAGIEALRFAWPWADRLRVMTAGDDTMVYESYARDILMNGVLMNGGAPLGQGEPFYYQALYPYFLAATHLVFGESMFGALLVQRLLAALTVLLLTRIAVQLAGEAVAFTALLVSTFFVWWKVAPIAADILNESLYVPLLCAWTVVLLELHRRPSIRRASLAGVLGGVTALTRSTALLGWSVAWLLTYLRLKPVEGRSRIVAMALSCSIGIFSMIAMRNWLVTDRFIPGPTEFGITLLGGNQPPPSVRIDMAARHSLYVALGIDGHTAQVIEYSISAPAHFAGNMARKAVFALGIYEPYAPGWGYSPVYVATVLAAMAGVLSLLQLRSGLERMTALVPLLIALTQYAAVVLVYPKGERLILPIHVLLVPYAAIAVARFVAALSSPRDSGSTLATM